MKAEKETLAETLRGHRGFAEKLRIAVQLACDHDEFAEASYESGGGTRRPFRTCIACGFTEQGWGCGYQILTGPCPEIFHEALRGYQVGSEHPNRRFVRDGAVFDTAELYRRAVMGEPEIG